MASGRTHVAGTLALTPLTAVVAWHLTQGNANSAMLAALGCLSGILISPDLDMAGKTISESILLRWNILIGKIWVALWFPYAVLSKHRGLSHVPIFGTLGRMMYLAAFYFAAHLLLQHYYAMDLLQWPQLYWYELFIFVAGLTISDIGHWVLDGCRF